jgi:Tfp pilus assembly protein PilO
MTSLLYLLTICLPLGTVLLVFGMRYYALIQQAKARLGNDDAYRRIAEQSATAQSETAATLSSIQATLADVGARLTGVEKILKAVE